MMSISPRLQADLATNFPPVADDDFAGLARQAIAGEYFGLATVEGLARAAPDAANRRFWCCMGEVELATINCVEPWMTRRSFPLPDRDTMIILGEKVAASFAGQTFEGYRDWVAPLIPPAIDSFRIMLSLCANAEDRAVCEQLLAHEIALAESLARLPEGLDAAVSTLNAHLDAVGFHRAATV